MYLIGLSLAASLEPLARIVEMWPGAYISLLYRYLPNTLVDGRCSSELAQLVPLPFYRGKSTRYSDRLHDFSVAIPYMLDV